MFEFQQTFSLLANLRFENFVNKLQFWNWLRAVTNVGGNFSSFRKLCFCDFMLSDQDERKFDYSSIANKWCNLQIKHLKIKKIVFIIDNYTVFEKLGFWAYQKWIIDPQ